MPLKAEKILEPNRFLKVTWILKIYNQFNLFQQAAPTPSVLEIVSFHFQIVMLHIKKFPIPILSCNPAAPPFCRYKKMVSVQNKNSLGKFLKFWKMFRLLTFVKLFSQAILIFLKMAKRRLKLLYHYAHPQIF